MLFGECWRWFEDEQEIRDKYWTIKPNDVVVDIGCHIGSYTIPALEAGATVYAIDPNKVQTKVLASLVEDSSKLTLLEIAIAEERGYSDELRNSITNSIKKGETQYDLIHAQADDSYMSLDNLVNKYNIQKLDWLKIDVEGAELSVLKSGERTLSRFKPKIILEDHSGVYAFVDKLQIGKQCRTLLKSLNYAIEEFQYENKGAHSHLRTFLICT